MDYGKQILDAVETIVNSAVSKADYDKTIKATVVDCIDKNTGKYKIKYQDSTFEAYSNSNNIYKAGTRVNVLIPRNDMRQTKVILGVLAQEDANDSLTIETENYYDTIGTNAIISTHTFGLCSYNGKTSIVLYDRDKDINRINFDELAVAANIKNGDSLTCAAMFKTNLAEEQQKKGNYGMSIDIDFKNNTDGSTITNTYTIDINEMKGNPYNLIEETRQSKIFNIQTDNYISIKKIRIFAENFPTLKNGMEDDIFISNLAIFTSRALSEEEKSNYSLKISSDKSYFRDADTPDSEIIIISSIILGPNELDIDSNSLKYYYFKQNNDVKIGDREYLSQGGAGWECLNKYSTIDTEGNRKYISQKNTFTVKKRDCLSNHNIYKVVAILSNNEILSNTIDIINYGADYAFEIVSDQGTDFNYDNGNPTLTLTIENEKDYSYKWTVEDNNGVSLPLEETTEYNLEYNVAKARYDLLQAQLDRGDAMPAASQKELNDCLAIVQKYDDIQRIEKNKIYKVDLSKITDYSIFNCSVYKNQELVGTAEIKINNSTSLQGNYSLSIVNGVQTFNYSAEGIAPTNESLENPITLNDLKIDIIDGQGNHFSDKILKSCNIKWNIPTERTMLSGHVNSDRISFHYDIADRYAINNLDNNTISVEVQYKNLILYAYTSFTFVKDGEPGTNGTNIICKIVPNIKEKIEYYPTIVNGKLNYAPENANQWFKVQLWQNGQMIWSGVDSDSKVKITWSNLLNQKDDITSIKINDNNFNYDGYHSEGSNIIKATVEYNGLIYYSTIPVLVAETNPEYMVNLIKDSGFRYVVYSGDGRTPQYDNSTPFKIIVKKNINNYMEDVSEKCDYEWKVQGTEKNLIENLINKNKAVYIPKEEYNGEIVNNALEVIVKDNDVQIGKIHIPIHFYLNRYGVSAINGWDGNKISLNDDEGAILAPQVGAGSKNDKNQFTGIVMGAVKEAGKKDIEQGLLGYSEGERTIFLDAQTGSARFGKEGKGQIILDPTDDLAQIKSGNYNEEAKTGMLIDLTKPELKWGNGAFSVDQNGNMVAKNGSFSGDIYLDSSGRTVALGKDGLLSNLRYETPWGEVGFTSDINDNITYATLQLNYSIPRNFTVLSAWGTMFCSAINQGYSTYDANYNITNHPVLGVPKQLKLYKASSGKCPFVGSWANSEYIINTDIADIESEIPNAFGSSSYTLSNTTPRAVTIVNTIDLVGKININEGSNSIALRTGLSNPGWNTMNNETALRYMTENTGAAKLILNIIGYMRI